MSGGLRRTITPVQGVALYTGAVVGAGVLLLPGLAASLAGPSSLLAWAFDCALGLPLAFTFARLAARYPDAGVWRPTPPRPSGRRPQRWPAGSTS